MRLFENDRWLSDLNETLTSLPELNSAEGKTIMVTGASGLICSAVVDLLIRWNETHSGKITILAAGRNQQKMERRFAQCCGNAWFRFVYYDAVSSENDLADSCDYIIHGAGNAHPGIVAKEPVETMLANFLGVKNLLDYAAGAKVKRLLYISSSEIYGQKTDNHPFSEGDYGYVNLLNPRNAYSVGKRAAETLCASYAAEFGVESVIVRPGHIYGPTASANDNRVSSQWAYTAARGEDIVMKSDGSQIRSYCHCLDCASAILKVLLKGESGQAYNISNPNSIISIRQMAEIISREAVVNVKMEIPSEDEQKSFNPMNHSSLDSTKLQSLGWEGLFCAERGFGQTIEILRSFM